MSLLVFLHGYLGSPRSVKAQHTARWLSEKAPGWQYACPELPPFAEPAMSLLKSIIDASDEDEIGLVGSSMGGFYATWLAQHYGLKAVLINPVTSAHDLLAEHVGVPLSPQSGQKFVLKPEHIEAFRKLQIKQVEKPENYLVLLQTGDEVLDYRLAKQKYRECRLVVEEGGDHSFTGYQNHLPEIFEFLSAR